MVAFEHFDSKRQISSQHKKCAARILSAVLQYKLLCACEYINYSAMEPRLRASPEQFSALIEFMERHGDLSRPQAGAQGRLRGDRLWQELTSLLNSIGGGVEKTQDKWKKIPSQPQSQSSEEPTIQSEGSEIQLILEVPNTLPSPPELPLSTLPPPPPSPATQPSQSQQSPPQHQPRTPPRSSERPVSASPRSAAATPRRRLQLRARRNRGQTPFDRAASEFVAIEQRRLQLEEMRERHQHEREGERLRQESEKIEVAREHNQLLRQLGVVAEKLLDTLSHIRPSLPSTDILPETE